MLSENFLEETEPKEFYKYFLSGAVPDAVGASTWSLKITKLITERLKPQSWTLADAS